MNKLLALPIALALLAANPAMGQDFLGPIQDFVDNLTEQPAERPTAPRPVPPSAEPVTPPPVPRPRPPSLPDEPVVELPQAPVVIEPVESEPEADADIVERPEAEPEVAPVTEEAEPVAEPVAAPEPERVYQVACPAVIMGLVEAEMAPPLSEGNCGEQSPLVVTAVMSRGRMVPLSSPITTNCQMASALPRWLETVDGYAEAMLGSRLAEVQTGTSYMCRGRVGGNEAATSEHGFANAVDVVGFALEDGQSVAVQADWAAATAPEGRLLRLAHDAACGSFMTVLGPEANAEHEDHLHLDLGCHGASCQTRICE